MERRRQLTLFLPEPEKSFIDAVRSSCDPIQFQLISAHVTLCRESEVTDWSQVWKRVVGVAGAAIEFKLGRPELLEDGCILIPLLGETVQYDNLRKQILGHTPTPMRPHITLLHPRNSLGKVETLEQICRERLPDSTVLDEVAMIEQSGGEPWTTLVTHDCK